MKCSKCGQEFGDGTNCQNCGIDRVTGLANFSGYYGPEGDTMNNASSFSQNHTYVPISQPNIVQEKSIVCYNCGEIIPANSKYCPHCSTSLYVTCPKCGHKYSSQYPACSQCGTNRENYEEEKKYIVPYGTTTIEAHSFENELTLKEVIIPPTVTIIGLLSLIKIEFFLQEFS